MMKYQSHKVVEAARIDGVRYPSRGEGGGKLFLDGNWTDIASDWFEKHEPHAGGYFVRYADGYESFSPAEAFESGYRPLEAAAPPGPPFIANQRQAELLNGIRYHNCSPEQGARMSEWRQTIYDTMVQLFRLTPPSADQTLAAQALTDALMRGNKAIVCEAPENAQPLPREVKR